jgi:hypothetical protein
MTFLLNSIILVIDHLLKALIKMLPEQHNFLCMLINFLPFYEEFVHLVIDIY